MNYIKNIIDNIGTDNLSFEKIKNQQGIIKDYFLVPSTSIEPFSLNFFIDDFYFNK